MICFLVHLLDKLILILSGGWCPQMSEDVAACNINPPRIRVYNTQLIMRSFLFCKGYDTFIYMPGFAFRCIQRSNEIEQKIMDLFNSSSVLESVMVKPFFSTRGVRRVAYPVKARWVRWSGTMKINNNNTKNQHPATSIQHPTINNQQTATSNQQQQLPPTAGNHQQQSPPTASKHKHFRP